MPRQALTFDVESRQTERGRSRKDQTATLPKGREQEEQEGGEQQQLLRKLTMRGKVRRRR